MSTFVSKENLQSVLNVFKANTTAAISAAVVASNQLNILVVAAKPTENISPTTIYLINKAEPTAENLYDEYMYVNGAWESFGDVTIDLTGYSTTSQMNAAISLALTDYITSTAVDGKISTALNAYSTTDQMNAAIAAVAPVAMTAEEITALNTALWV